MTKDFIDVPQGCYGIITHETPENIAGLVTSGMGPCSHIIVKNTNSNNMVLCHVDHATDLNDERH